MKYYLKENFRFLYDEGQIYDENGDVAYTFEKETLFLPKISLLSKMPSASMADISPLSWRAMPDAPFPATADPAHWAFCSCVNKNYPPKFRFGGFLYLYSTEAVIYLV